MAEDSASLSALERLVREGSEADLRRFLLLLQPPEIADLIEALEDPADRARTFRAIVHRTGRADVLRELEDPETTAALLDMPAHEAAHLLAQMQSDDAADVLQGMDASRQQEILGAIEPGEQAGLREILTYPPDSAGGIMQTELVRVREDRSARAAVEEIRRTRDEVGELHEVFVVDAQGRLRGWVKERDLILAEDDTPIRAITLQVPVVVPVTMDQARIASLVRDYDLSSVPVVNERGRLLGRILVDDIVDVFEEEATEDLALAAGTDAVEIYEPTVRRALRARGPWLAATFAGGIVAALVMNAGDALVKEAGKLFIFIPVVMGMGGGAASQAATVTVRGLELGRLRASGVWRAVRKEVTVGLLLALATGVLVSLLARLLGGRTDVALIAAFAVFGTIAIGTSLGVLTPLMLSRLGLDPVVATGPLVTTLNDVLGSSLLLWACWLML